MKLKYKNFEFPMNPESLKISSSTNCEKRAVFGKNSIVQNVSLNPVTVTGNGEFYGDKGDEYCAVLQNMLKNKSSGWLFLPGGHCVKVFFTEFSFHKKSKKNAVQYSFAFTEDCTDRKAQRNLKYTLAEKDENAFEIANRCDVSVNDIMKLNDLKSPFDINFGDRVVLR